MDHFYFELFGVVIIIWHLVLLDFPPRAWLRGVERIRKLLIFLPILLLEAIFLLVLRYVIQGRFPHVAEVVLIFWEASTDVVHSLTRWLLHWCLFRERGRESSGFLCSERGPILFEHRRSSVRVEAQTAATPTVIAPIHVVVVVFIWSLGRNRHLSLWFGLLTPQLYFGLRP